MPVQGRVTPWTGRPEWQFVAERIFSEDPIELGKALAVLNAWRMRGNHPPATETTYNLRTIQLWRQQGLLDDTCTRLGLSATLVRFVNEVVDPHQQGAYAMPVAMLAERHNVPRILVDIRHAATHDHLPSLETLLLGVDLALKWLCEYYWEPQLGYRDMVRATALATLNQYLGAGSEGEALRSTVGWPVRCLSEVQALEQSREVQMLFLGVALGHPGSFNDLILLVDTLAIKDDSLTLAFMGLEPADQQQWERHQTLLTLAASRIRTLPTLVRCVKQCYLNVESNGLAFIPIIARNHQVASVPPRLQQLMDALMDPGHQRLPSDKDLLRRSEALFAGLAVPGVEAAAPEAGWHVPVGWRPVPLGQTEAFDPVTDFLLLYNFVEIETTEGQPEMSTDL